MIQKQHWVKNVCIIALRSQVYKIVKLVWYKWHNLYSAMTSALQMIALSRTCQVEQKEPFATWRAKRNFQIKSIKAILLLKGANPRVNWKCCLKVPTKRFQLRQLEKHVQHAFSYFFPSVFIKNYCVNSVMDYFALFAEREWYAKYFIPAWQHRSYLWTLV